MARITEKELILPALFLINESAEKKLTTTELIDNLRKLLNPDEEDLLCLDGRKDDRFSQKVRNLRAHRTLEKNNYTIYEDKIFKITDDGVDFLDKNQDRLKLMITEEQFLYQSSVEISSYYDEFKKSLINVEALSKMSGIIDKELKTHFLNMLYSSVITILETYLSDALKFNLNRNKDFLIRFVETFKDYQEIKCSFNNIFNICDTIEERIEDTLLELLYHNLAKIKGIYKSTFDIDFQDINYLAVAVSIRHDLIHRNGRKKNNQTHNITKEQVVELCEKTFEFIQIIEGQFQEIRNQKSEV